MKSAQPHQYQIHENPNNENLHGELSPHPRENSYHQKDKR